MILCIIKLLRFHPLPHYGMKKEVKVAIIGGIATIITAIITGFFGLLGPQKHGSTAINGNNNIVAGGNVTLSQGASEEQLSAIDKKLANLERIARQQNVSEARNDPSFQQIVRNIYGKSFDALSEGERITLWDNVLKALARAAEAEKNYEIVKQGTVSADLKALFPKIEAARLNFDYGEVNRLLAEFRDKHADLRQDLAKVDYLQGQTYELQLNYPEAERYYKKAAAIEDENPLYLDAHATMLWKMGRYDEAEPLYRRALAIGEKAIGPHHPEVGTRLNNLANLLHDQGNYRDAEPLFRRAIAIDEKALGPNHPSVATDLNNLASLLHDQGNYKEAEPLYRRALAIDEKALGSNHPGVATDLNNLASLLYTQGNYRDAEPLLRRAIAINEKVLGPNHPLVATNLNNLAELLRTQGNYDKAEPLHRRAIVIREKTLGPEHPDVAQSLNNLASLLYAQGNYRDAEPLFRRALAILEKSLGPKHPNTISCTNNLNTLLEEKKATK